jgi:hypothetical protein
MNYTAVNNGQRQATDCVGSLDHAAAHDQMRAIDAVLQQYFQTREWLQAREREMLRKATPYSHQPPAPHTHVFEE